MFIGCSVGVRVGVIVAVAVGLGVLEGGSGVKVAGGVAVTLTCSMLCRLHPVSRLVKINPNKRILCSKECRWKAGLCFISITFK